MAYWWDNHPEEKYWCEITDRPDVGADLKCPQTNESGSHYWSYGLIGQIAAGDVVFHYSTPTTSFVGASVAGAPLEERPIIWMPHGTVGRRTDAARVPRPGWWLPLYGYRSADKPLTLDELQTPEQQRWIRAWIANAQREHGTTGAPIQPYPGRLRAAQGYLTKMPFDFLSRLPKLAQLADSLDSLQTRLEILTESFPPGLPEDQHRKVFKPKSSAEYRVYIEGGIQTRSRKHEALVRSAGELLKKYNAVVSTPHPIDLFVSAPQVIIIEAKIVGDKPAGAAIREAVGQLFEYRYFVGPVGADLCVVLDEAPPVDFVKYAEEALGLLLVWISNDRLVGGPITVGRLHGVGVQEV